MGYRIENYSLSELNRISIPGNITPSVFWLIPIGRWLGNDLECLWEHFTSGNNNCKRYGLLLAKEKYRRNLNSDTEKIDLTGVISELLPGGNKNHYKSEANGNVLILSASYPLPGWGLLLSIENPHHLEKLLTQVFEHSQQPNFIETNTILNKFDNAAIAFKEFELKKHSEPLRVTNHEKKPEIDRIKEVIRLIKEYLEANFLGLALNRAINSVNWDLFPEDLKKLSQNINLLITEKYILANKLFWLSEEHDNSELQEIFSQIPKLPKNPSEFFNSISNEELKTAAGLIFKTKFDIAVDDYIEWAKEYYNSNKKKFGFEIKNYSDKLYHSIGVFITEEEEFEREFKEKEKRWIDEREILRIAKHRTLNDAVNAQQNFGPEFLYNLELHAIKMGYNPVSIAWDQPRMIGWKIFCNNIPIHIGDIKGSFIEEFQDVITSGDEIEETTINGSYFTDYVHFITLSNTDRNPRTTTHEILKKVLRPSEIKKVLNVHGKLDIEEKSIDFLTEELISAFGWPKIENNIQDTLASCLLEVDGKININRKFEGNKLRIVFESFCKDLINTSVSELCYSENDLWELIKNKSEFRRDERKNWRETVKTIMIGPAVILLKTITPIAFPHNIEISEKLIDSIKGVEFLNKFSHDNPDFTDTEKEECFIKLLTIIPNILKYTNDLISEMPWHITVTQKYGTSPMVLTGNGWSHSHKAPRLLRVILLEEPESSNVVIWNPSKINPVISDGKLISP